MYAPFGTMRRTSSWRAFLGKKESPQPMLFSSLAKSSKYRAVLPIRGEYAAVTLTRFYRHFKNLPSMSSVPQ